MTTLIVASLLVSLAINILLFSFAFINQSDKLTDISYAVSFLAIDLYAYFKSFKPSLGSTLIFLLVAFWSLRIGIFLLIRVARVGKDRRFDEIRGSLLKFLRFWIGQALTAWIMMLPVVFFQATKNNGLKALSLLGIVLWTVGYVVEAIADYQKFKFKLSNNQRHPWIDSGLWKYSRHPNYFGEITVWIGVYVFCFSTLSTTDKIISLLSPILITCLLLFISGVPVLEKSADQKWGRVKAYQVYKSRTRLLIPLGFIKL